MYVSHRRSVFEGPCRSGVHRRSVFECPSGFGQVMWYKPLYQWTPPIFVTRLISAGQIGTGLGTNGPQPHPKKTTTFDRSQGAMPTDHVHGHAYGPWPWPCLRTMAMAMPTDHGHGHAHGPWPWPCLGTPDQAPSSVEEKERYIGQPASLKKQSPFT